MTGNPLLGGPMAMLQNSPIGKLISMMQAGQNPQALVQQLMNQNPDFANVVNSFNGKDQNQVNDMIANAAKQKGVDLKQLATQIGMPPDIARKYGINME